MSSFTKDQVLIKSLIETANLEELKRVLQQNAALANEGLPYDEENTTKAHPLHRICDAVFTKKITDEQAIEVAKIFLGACADVDGGDLQKNKDTPLVAAASLHADKLALLYIEEGADIHHGGCHGGTALHWACWCGRPVVVKKLIEEGAEINRLCEEFKSTPLFWSVHGLRFGEGTNTDDYAECVKLLLAAGADKSIPNFEGYKPIEVLRKEDVELYSLLTE